MIGMAGGSAEMRQARVKGKGHGGAPPMLQPMIFKSLHAAMSLSQQGCIYVITAANGFAFHLQGRPWG